MKPTVTECPVKHPAPLHAPAGAVVMEVGSQNTIYGSQYIRYMLPKAERKGKYEDTIIAQMTGK